MNLIKLFFAMAMLTPAFAVAAPHIEANGKVFSVTGFGDWESSDAETRATEMANHQCLSVGASQVSEWVYHYYGRLGGSYNTKSATADFACSQE